MISLEDRAHLPLSLHVFNRASAGPVCISSWGQGPGLEEVNILRMPLKLPGTGYRIPSNLGWLVGLIGTIIDKQESSTFPKKEYCYLTVRNRSTQTNNSNEWHVDGYSERVPHFPEQNYIWCNDMGTEFYPKPVSFPKDFDAKKHNIHTYLQKTLPHSETFISGQRVYLIDPYVVHREPSLTEAQRKKRCFVRVTFTELPILDDLATPNPDLPVPLCGITHHNDLRTSLIDYPVEHT